uniref:Uncharacterized protein n=1 Tax=viral metagenome TaxID=1070528 RepID=A0A6C0CQB3_9ZZZZ
MDVINNINILAPIFVILVIINSVLLFFIRQYTHVFVSLRQSHNLNKMKSTSSALRKLLKHISTDMSKQDAIILLLLVLFCISFPSLIICFFFLIRRQRKSR